MKTYTFYMNDAWGDDYFLNVQARTEKEARSIANMSDDDATAGKLKEVK